MNTKIYTAPVPRMPPGLIELMEGLAKDVLKNNPSDIFEFCSKHMEKLLKIRDGDAAKNGLTLSQKITRAQEKVRQRSELRKKQYDEEIQSLNVNDENQKHCKREVNVEIEPIYKQEVSVGIMSVDNLDNVEKNTIYDVINEEAKRDIEVGNAEGERQEDANEPPPAELNSKNVIDDITGFVENTDGSECFENSNDKNELMDIKNITVLTEDENIADIIRNSKDGEGEHMDMMLVENENNSTSNSETADINLKLIEVTNNNNNSNKPIEDLTSKKENDHNESKDLMELRYFDQNNITEINENNVPEDSLENEGNLKNHSEMFVITKEKDSDSDTQNNFSNDMDLEKAAITIQKVFRSFLFRSKTSSMDDATSVDVNMLIEDTNNEKHEMFETATMMKDMRSLGLNRMDTVLQTVNEEKSLSLSTDDSSTLSSAATIIQAHVRGFLVRNKLNFNKTISTASNIESDIQSPKSLEKDVNNLKNKTVLNIHIVPEGGNYLSRDESMMTSIDLPLDRSPPHSSNLHPLGYDKNERRKQLKREDAIQSVSPPSNNSGKSDDIESIKEVLPHHDVPSDPQKNHQQSFEAQVVNNNHEQLIADSKLGEGNGISDDITQSGVINQSTELNNLTESSSDEMDVVTPFVTIEENESMELNKSRLLHSGEFHDIALPTVVSRSNTSVVREFQNVFVYFLLWNNP